MVAGSVVLVLVESGLVIRPLGEEVAYQGSWETKQISE
jgi:hypothetical protein